MSPDERQEIEQWLNEILKPQSPWLDAQGCADYLRLKVKSVYNLSAPSAANRLPFHRIPGGGAKRYHRYELDTWLKASASSSKGLRSDDPIKRGGTADTARPMAPGGKS